MLFVNCKIWTSPHFSRRYCFSIIYHNHQPLSKISVSLNTFAQTPLIHVVGVFFWLQFSGSESGQFFDLDAKSYISSFQFYIMKTIVTGGEGFLDSHLCDLLVQYLMNNIF